VQILVQEHVAVVSPVSEIVNDEDVRRAASESRFPAGIECVVINDQPIYPLAGKRCDRKLRIGALTCAKPVSMRQFIRAAGARLRGKRQYLVPILGCQFAQAGWHLAANELDFGPSPTERVRESKATHEMTSPHLVRRVDPNRADEIRTFQTTTT
jgi:hypothetical protein